MIHARAALISHIRTFVETELSGMVNYDQLEHYIPEQSEKIPGKRANIFGKYREIATVRFGNYELTVKSPNESPPLGEAALTFLGGRSTGPLDIATWKLFGAIIRTREAPERIAS